jgi:hypothetical protein
LPAIIDSSAIHAVFEQPLPDGRFESAHLRYLQAAGARRPILFLAFAPKAAGTYFRQAAIFAIKGQLVRATHAQGGRDGTPYLPNILSCLLDADARPSVMHIHMQALPANRHFIEACGLKPVIMLRSVPDLLASFTDMLDADPVARAEGLNCLVPREFVTWDKETKTDFVVDVIGPWYASYFATWKDYVATAPDRIAVLSHSEFCSDPSTVLQEALAHAGFCVTRNECQVALDQTWMLRKDFRYNRGIEGRGAAFFSPRQHSRLYRMFAYYPQLEDWLPLLRITE